MNALLAEKTQTSRLLRQLGYISFFAGLVVFLSNSFALKTGYANIIANPLFIAGLVLTFSGIIEMTASRYLHNSDVIEKFHPAAVAQLEALNASSAGSVEWVVELDACSLLDTHTAAL